MFPPSKSHLTLKLSQLEMANGIKPRPPNTPRSRKVIRKHEMSLRVPMGLASLDFQHSLISTLSDKSSSTPCTAFFLVCRRCIFSLRRNEPYAGVVKTQWLDAWIREPATLRKSTEKTPREIDQIHDYLKAVSYSVLRICAYPLLTLPPDGNALMGRAAAK